MWSIAHRLLATSILVGQLVVGSGTPKAIRTDPDGNQVEIDLKPGREFNPFPGQIASPARHDASSDDPDDPDGGDGPEYSLNWCGVKANMTLDNPIVWVQGSFRVPTLKVHALEPLPQMLEAWIGVGGDTCHSALLQAGVYATIDTVGAITSQNTTMFVRLWPGFNYQLDEHLSPDDEFHVTIDLTDPEQIFITTNNVSKNTTDNFITSYNVSIPMPPQGICPGDVEWVVSTGSEGKAFADFAPVKFFNSKARRGNTYQIFAADAELVWVQDGKGNVTCNSQKTDNSMEVVMTRQN